MDLENTEIQDALERVSKDPEEVLNGVLKAAFDGLLPDFQTAVWSCG